VVGSYDGAVIGERFRIGPAPTLLTRTASIAPIGFTRLRSEQGNVRAKDVPSEAAYSFHVVLRSVAADLWLDGRHILAARASPGDAFLFDLRANPVSELHGAFDILRCYISQDSLDELSFDRGQRRAVSLDTGRLGVPDPVMYGLAQALLGRVEHANERSALFIDRSQENDDPHFAAARHRRSGRPDRHRFAQID
jgi:hypothetical protein